MNTRQAYHTFVSCFSHVGYSLWAKFTDHFIQVVVGLIISFEYLGNLYENVRDENFLTRLAWG